MLHWSEEQDNLLYSQVWDASLASRLGKPLAATEQVVGSIGEGSDLTPTTLDPRNSTLVSGICYGPVSLLSTDF